MVLILLTDIADNLLWWFHTALLTEEPCDDFGILHMVKDLLTICDLFIVLSAVAGIGLSQCDCYDLCAIEVAHYTC